MFGREGRIAIQPAIAVGRTAPSRRSVVRSLLNGSIVVDMAGGGDPPHVYSHTVPKPKRAGLAALASLLFMGGGQLVKGHFRRFLALWGILVGAVAIFLGAVIVLVPSADTASLTRSSLAVTYSLLWVYSLWDAVTRP